MDYFGDGQPARDSSLRDSANLTAVIDACPLAVMVLASDGTVRLWNPACARMFGWTADEAIGQFLPAIPRERQAEFRSNLEAVLRGNAFTGVETIRQRKGGGSVDVAIWAVPVVDADGQVGCLSMLADISERKRAERTQAFLGEVSDVLASSLDYSETINRICRLTVPILADYCQIYLVEGTGRLQRIAVAHADPARDALARSLVRRYPLSLTDEDPTSQAVRTGRSVIEPCLTDDQLNRMARDPDHRQILQSLDIGSGISVPIQARGKVIGALVLARGRDSAPFPPGDVRTAEELVRRAGLAIENARLFESEQKARRDAEHAADRVTRLQTITASLVERLTPEQIATIVVDQAIGALGAERGAMGLLVEGGSVFEVVRAGGYPEAEMIQSELRRWERFPVSRGGTWAEVARTGEAVFTVSGADRVARHPEIAGAQEALGLNATATLPLAAGGRIKGVLWLGFPGAHAFDGSEREFLLALARHCSQALERASLDLAEREALELRNEFLSVAAHELKTPMTALRGSVQLLLRLREKQGFIEENRLLARLALIDEQTGKMSRLVDQLLDISRIEAGRLTLERAPTDLAAIVRGVAANAQARSEQHAITVRADGPLLVSGDALRLEQVIANLVDNAIKYSPGGGPIELAVTGCAPDQACVTVTDHGIGIAPEHRGHIFDRFFQAHSGQYFGGMGLGLYISHQIVDLHGGSLEVEFPESGGTRFVARLPAKLLEEESKIPP